MTHQTFDFDNQTKVINLRYALARIWATSHAAFVSNNYYEIDREFILITFEDGEKKNKCLNVDTLFCFRIDKISRVKQLLLLLFRFQLESKLTIQQCRSHLPHVNHNGNAIKTTKKKIFYVIIFMSFTLFCLHRIFALKGKPIKSSIERHMKNTDGFFMANRLYFIAHFIIELLCVFSTMFFNYRFS